MRKARKAKKTTVKQASTSTHFERLSVGDLLCACLTYSHSIAVVAKHVDDPKTLKSAQSELSRELASMLNEILRRFGVQFPYREYRKAIASVSK